MNNSTHKTHGRKFIETNFLGGWQEVDCRTAKCWAWDKWHGVTNMPDTAEKLAYINSRLEV